MLIKECMKCPRPAVIHVTEVAAKGPPVKIAEIHLCFEHAVEAGWLGAAVPSGQAAGGKSGGQKFSGISDLDALQHIDSDLVLTGMDVVDTTVPSCPMCGTTWGQFKKQGLLGCPNDYAHFEPQLMDLIPSMHEHHTGHIGKIPPQSAAADTIARAKKIRLEAQLSAAIQGERYEEAARLRDQLRTIFGPM